MHGDFITDLCTNYVTTPRYLLFERFETVAFRPRMQSSCFGLWCAKGLTGQKADSMAENARL